MRQQNVLGLDIMRGVAIILVMVSHWANNIGAWAGWQAPRRIFVLGEVGVDIFFALSGFLIGRLLIDIIERAPSARNLWVFLVRRWVRTVPLYMLWLCVLAWLHPTQWHQLPWFATFTQNLVWGMPGAEGEFFFAVSWSLAIEEWFYLLAGTILILGATVLPWKAVLALTLAALIAIPLSLRILTPPEIYVGRGLYISVLYRLDGIAYGVVMAALFRSGSRIYDWPLTLLALGVAMIVSTWLQLMPLPGVVWLALPPTLYAVGAGLCIPAALMLPDAARWFAAPVRQLSQQAYGLYITHNTVLVMIVQPWFFGKHLDLWSAAALAIGLPFLLSWASWRYFESPLLRLRPKQDLTPAARVSSAAVQGARI